MKSIKQIISIAINQPDELTSEQILDVFLKVGQEGDVIILKNDGIREINTFSIIIISSKGLFESIRIDGGNLSEVLKIAVSRYIEF